MSHVDSSNIWFHPLLVRYLYPCRFMYCIDFSADSLLNIVSNITYAGWKPSLIHSCNIYKKHDFNNNGNCLDVIQFLILVFNDDYPFIINVNSHHVIETHTYCLAKVLWTGQTKNCILSVGPCVRHSSVSCPPPQIDKDLASELAIWPESVAARHLAN